MLDYPPKTPAFIRDDTSASADSGQVLVPDLRTPGAFLRWKLGRQRPLIVASILVGCLWQLPLTVGPLLVGRAVDRGILPGDNGEVLLWAGLLLGVTLVGAAFGIVMHTIIVRSWLIALYGTTQMVTRKSVQLGHVLPRRAPTGEVLSVAGSDSDEFGALTEITARASCQLIAYLVVAVIVLDTSLPLGLMVLVAAPILVGIALPFLRPLHRRQALERSRNSDLTSLATDIVAGLRILRGIGGERTFGRNYDRQSQLTRKAGVSAGVWQAGIESLGVLFSGGFIVLLVWAGSREVLAGDLSVGELISFLGYGLFMIGPIQTFFEFAQKLTRALVSARKAIGIFEQEPPWSDPADPQPLPESGDLVDARTGLVAHPGELTIVVSAVPEDSSALADRLGRYFPADDEAVPIADDEELSGRAARRARAERLAERQRIAEREAAHAAGPWGVTWGGVDLNRARLSEVRRRIVVSDTGSQLFAGTLQDAIDPHGVLTREQAETVVRVANAEDVYDAQPGGWQGVLEERGRGLSGGQRQRVVLARALGADAPVLVLVEPTSAVDAHTEARIAERVAAFRRGRTTIITTVSPLWLHHADRIVLLEGDRAVADGTHEDLLIDSPAYRRVVSRALDEVAAPSMVEPGARDERRSRDQPDPGQVD